MWHLVVYSAINTLLTLFTLVLGVVAFIHCAIQRSDAFPAIGTLQKPAWLAIIGVATVLALLTSGSGFGMIFHLIAIAASALYLLDVRPGLRDITNGRGSW
jgi:4-amino-4-deoxy-L-arabinose transferase-like glycosyltransferase